jgi:hypothetical protein
VEHRAAIHLENDEGLDDPRSIDSRKDPRKISGDDDALAEKC